MFKLPLYYYPTTIMWVDDDLLFLNAAKQLYDSNVLHQTFDDPIQCQNFFQNYTTHTTANFFLRGCTEHDHYETIDHAPVDFNVLHLANLAQYQPRHEEVSVIIVDYNMKKLNGIELCHILKRIPAKKILLTGEANQSDAISAFNDNLIDRYIRKDNPNLASELKLYIEELQQYYFQEKTLALLTHLEANHPLPMSDPTFVNVFQNFCLDNKIKEYYLMDKNGSFLMINEQNERHYFVVHTDRTLKAFINLHDDIAGAAPWLNKVQAREKIPFFGIGKDAWQFELHQWQQFFYNPQKINGNEEYFVTSFKEINN